MYELRLANKNDINEIYELISELEEIRIPIDRFKDVYYENMNNNYVKYFVAEDSKNIIGFISVHIQMLLHHASKIAEIQELIVTSNYQGRGIGGLLFNKVKEYAVINNCTQLEVCCNQNRVNSHKFYLKQGMTNHHYKFCLNLNQ